MSVFKFGKRSNDNLVGVHPDLHELAQRALELTTVDFGITQGVRTKEQQTELVRSGASSTMNSRHLTGHAIDIVCYKGGGISWHWPLYEKVYEAFREAGRELDIPFTWGGNWVNFKDGPHYELTWKDYPKEGE